ncbi:MAG TPA: hypothetical protein VJC09_00015 [Candidatus Saccharimonadales bacterium]|nr:hypothetical protein [Candidatus Saccharimonadales bacterium]
MSEFNIVAKGGGTTMAHPENFAEITSRNGYEPEILVVSAPGIDREAGFDARLTDNLILYGQYPRAYRGMPDHILHRMEAFAARLDPTHANGEIDNVLAGVK